MTLTHIVRAVLWSSILLAAQSPARAQVPADQAAALLLNAANKAFGEQNYPFAAEKYREYLQKFGGNPNAPQARFALAMSLIDGPQRDYDKALEQLNPLAGDGNFPDRARATYYSALAYRNLGINELAQIAVKPNEAQQLRDRSTGRFNDALVRFTAADKLFTDKLPKDAGEKVSVELDWVARSRIDRAEMELRLGKLKEALKTAEPFVKEATFAKSRYHKQGLYYHGYAAFLSGDYLIAARSIDLCQPFADPVWGTHARYLKGRLHQISGDRAEANLTYEAVLADHQAQKKAAVEALKRPETFRNDAPEKLRLETLVKVAPDHVVAASFYSAALLYEAGRFAEALTKYQEYPKEFPGSALLPEAALRAGFCQVMLKTFPEAVATLTPLMDKQPKLNDQTAFWLGKAQLGQALAADPAKPQDRENGLKAALGSLRGAAERSQNLTQTDPEAKQRKGEALLELAEVQILLNQAREAANTCQSIVDEKLLPERAEEVIQRQIVALHLAADYVASDALCQTFLKNYPRSTLIPAVLFRLAENAYFVALAAKKKPDLANRDVELTKLFGEAEKRYRAVIDKAPEFDRIGYAWYGLAMTHFQRNEFDRAEVALNAIAPPDRANDLGFVPYFLAECRIRQVPLRADDALQVGMVREKLEAARGDLESFISSYPKAPETPDAYLKLAYCQSRLAQLNEVPQERNQAFQAARQTLEKLTQTYPQAPQVANARLEMARCKAYMGDKGGAINDLRPFTQDPLQNSPTAPTAVILLATLMREQNQNEPASQMLQAARVKYEANPQKDPLKLALIRYHQGVCQQEAGKFAEARATLEGIVVDRHPVTAEAALRAGQCRAAEARKSMETARQQMGDAAKKPAAEQAFNLAQNSLIEASNVLDKRADELKVTLGTDPARARMYYEAAWIQRGLSEAEVAAKRLMIQQDLQKKLQDEANKKTPANVRPVTVLPPDVPLKDVPVTPTEKRTRELYLKLIEQFPDPLLSVDARFELAELSEDRGDFDSAIKLLREAIDKEPADKPATEEQQDRIRVRLGSCLTSKKAYDDAMTQFEIVASHPKTPLILRAQAEYRAAECLLEKGDLAKAVARLAPFRDKGEYHNFPGLSDRAMARLGYALGLQKNWEASKQAYEFVTARYGNSPWVHDARYGAAWAMQNANQLDNAVNYYNQVIAGTTSELAAKAHLQIGLVRIAQKKYAEAVSALLVVPYTFDYPELSALALTEAARALIEDKKPEQAERLIARVLKEYPTSAAAKTAGALLSPKK